MVNRETCANRSRPAPAWRRLAGQLARIAVCALLLLWIFHVIFCNEAQLFLSETGGTWSSMTKWEQRSLAWTRGPSELWRMTRRIHPLALAAAFVQCGLLVVLGGFRWRQVMRIQGLELSYRETTRISFVAHFFNAFLLGSTGGDVVKAWYAARTTHHKKAEAVLSVFVDRLIGILALLLSAVALMPWNIPLILQYKRYAGACGVIVAMAVTAGGLVVIAFHTDALHHEGRFAHLFRRLPLGASVGRALAACRLFGRHPGFTQSMAAWSLVINFLLVGSFAVLAWGLHISIPPQALWMVVPMIICIAAIPVTPSGLGVRENLFFYLLSVPMLGVKPSEAVTLSLLAYSINLSWSALGGVVYLFMPDRGALKTADLEEEDVTS